MILPKNLTKIYFRTKAYCAMYCIRNPSLCKMYALSLGVCYISSNAGLIIKSVTLADAQPVWYDASRVKVTVESSELICSCLFFYDCTLNSKKTENTVFFIVAWIRCSWKDFCLSIKQKIVKHSFIYRPLSKIVATTSIKFQIF